jgi:5-methylcytosine-specific restriction endonuclease McrA
VRQRTRRLRQHPLCKECERQGFITPTDEIDHIVPLTMGGTDADANVQGLCRECHTRKTVGEAADRSAVARARALARGIWIPPHEKKIIKHGQRIGLDGWPIEEKK